MEFLVWRSVTVGNACFLEDVENVEKSSWTWRGIPLASEWPKDAAMQMTSRHKKNTALTDDISSYSRLKVCSPKVVDFLRSKKLKNVEYLPITILDHKGKVASKEHCLVHPIHPQDALDVSASQPEYNPIMEEDIDSVKKLVLDDKKLDPEVRLFRLLHYYTPVLMEKSLAMELDGMKLKGPTFIPLSEHRD